MKAPFIIALSGGSGSGKSTLIGMIQKDCPDILVLELDHYYLDRSHLSPSEREHLNFDHPDALNHKLLEEHLQKLLNYKTINRPSYDFKNHSQGPSQMIKPKPTIIIDGIFSLYFDFIRKVTNLKIYLEVPDDLRFIRRLKRDTEERGRTMASVVKQYETSARDMHKKYIEPCKQFADLIIPWENINQYPVSMITSAILHYHSQ